MKQQNPTALRPRFELLATLTGDQFGDELQHKILLLPHCVKYRF